MIARQYTHAKKEKSSKRTTTKVSHETLELLKSLKRHERETMESVIIMLIKHYYGEPDPPIVVR